MQDSKTPSLTPVEGHNRLNPDGRAMRQAIICGPHWQRREPPLATSADFDCTSSCRDLFINVIVPRFSIPQIAAVLREQTLSFLEGELHRAIVQLFQPRYQGAQAPTTLEYWHEFETPYRDTFRRTYAFEVRKERRSSS